MIDMMLASVIISQFFCIGKGEEKGAFHQFGNISMWICERCAKSERKRGQLGKTHAPTISAPQPFQLLPGAYPYPP